MWFPIGAVKRKGVGRRKLSIMVGILDGTPGLSQCPIIAIQWQVLRCCLVRLNTAATHDLLVEFHPDESVFSEAVVLTKA